MTALSRWRNFVLPLVASLAFNWAMPTDSRSRHDANALREFAAALLQAAGLSPTVARDVAEVLLEGDLLGHPTHGFALLPLYLKELAEGRMTKSGEPRLVADHGSAQTWDGNYLPGPWLVRRAIAAARDRLARHAITTIAIGRSHHIACLQAFLKPVTDDGLFILLTCSDPGNRWVAPFGGTSRVYSPDPIAAGIPTNGEPVLIDVSMSTTALGQVLRASKQGEKLPGPWLVDAGGRPSNDPRPILESTEGALYPLGGADLGHKGFGLALLVEALTSALAGHGRSSGDARWGSSVFLLLIDPARFGGREAFVRETSFLAAACRSADVPPGRPPVRLPGEGALARRREQLANGVKLDDGIMPALGGWAERLGVSPLGSPGV